MDKVNFQDGTKISSAKVTIDEVDYPVTPARYTGATPLSALVLNTMQDNIEDAINQNTDNIGGEDYDETSTYLTGDIVKYEGQLYIANQDIDTPEEWDSTHWDETDVLSSAGGNEVVIGISADITAKTKIFIDESEGTDAYSEVVNSLAGNEIAKAPSVHAVNEALDELTTYSTDEVKIGTWIDGKPLYRKVLQATFDQYTTYYYHDFSVSDISKIIKYEGFIDAVNQAPMIFSQSEGNQFTLYFTSNNRIRVYSSTSAYSGIAFYLIITYTKTTD